jgi:hypothetical protein
MDVICENAEYCQAKDNYIISDLLDRANKANDHTEIEPLRQYAKNCGLFEVEREIIEAWEAKQRELIEEMRLTWWQRFFYSPNF